jgi:putative two-component system response regulator
MTAALTAMRLLAVDDNESNLELIEQLLEEAGYANVIGTQDAASVPSLCASWKPDLLLLDLHMPRLNGYELLGAIRGSLMEPESLPVLVLTADATIEARRSALALGARDFLNKPIDEVELLLRVNNLLQVRHLQRELRDRNDVLEGAVRERTAELEEARLESLLVLARTAEYHDDDTHHHTQRVGSLATMIARELGLPDREIATLRDAAPLHDIGKVGISEQILRKPGPLTPEERAAMMQHVEIGSKILAGTRSPVLLLADEIARYHHERWDGNGYLTGVRGEQIPLCARITQVADVFDALTHERPYKAAWPLERARAEIASGAGSAFDPRVAAAFAALDVSTLGGAAFGDADAPMVPLRRAA